MWVAAGGSAQVFHRCAFNVPFCIERRARSATAFVARYRQAGGVRMRRQRNAQAHTRTRTSSRTRESRQERLVRMFTV